ncbi:cytotoxic necrotizing factor Rho-activating domain-containing protein [Paraburkholderia fungorum]|uniref:cytotoxic necrotizing factor Rho-activating domain-containing protein n=1 Tax=Paraburkholderia fungorum TaxID=134537 RepID=UPI0038B7E318
MKTAPAGFCDSKDQELYGKAPRQGAYLKAVSQAGSLPVGVPLITPGPPGVGGARSCCFCFDDLDVNLALRSTEVTPSAKTSAHDGGSCADCLVPEIRDAAADGGFEPDKTSSAHVPKSDDARLSMRITSGVAASHWQEPEPNTMARAGDERSARSGGARVKRSIPEDGPTASPPKKEPPHNGPDKVRYLGGIRVRTDYTLEDVLETVKDALKHPIGAFAASVSDVHHVVVHGRNITSQERKEIAEDTAQIDSVLVAIRGMTPGGGVMNVITVSADVLTAMSKDKPLTLDQVHDLAFSINDLPSGESAEIPIRREDGATAKAPSNRPDFNPPKRLPDGRKGYPLSPTEPPKLPGESTGSGASGQGARPKKAPPSGEPQAGTSEPQPGTSQKGSRSTIKSKIQGAFYSDANRVRKGDIAPLEGRGAIYLKAPGKNNIRFSFYRYDKDMKMSRPAHSSDIPPAAAQEVLRTGNGRDVTSFASNSNSYFGQWGRGKRNLSEQIDVIELENGREGVGAVQISFADIPPKGAVLVTTGSLSGCTAMFAADNQKFYAYHSGTSTPNANWKTAREGVSSLREAHEQLKPDAQKKALEQPSNNDLVDMANDYPFSVIAYSGKFNKARPQDDTRINRPEWEWSKGTHVNNYFEPDEKIPSIGTSVALIRKDARGRVTVSVLYEKGALKRAASKGRVGDPLTYDYKAIETEKYKFTPQGS